VRYVLAVTLVLSAVDVTAQEPTAALPNPATHKVDFLREIEPIFVRACHRCHGPEKQESGLRLDERQSVMDGGDNGPILESGNGAESELVLRVASSEPSRVMPPKGPRLSRREVGLIRAWIDQGADWPESATTGARPTHWSFVPVRRPVMPGVVGRDWLRSPIDAFILARLEAAQIRPSSQADRVTLIRRLSLDLLGLPPTPDDVDEFVTDTRPDAYERLVDRLLASPHFGEHWARFWLDLGRYADSDGYEKDLPRPYAWRWRDWVINSLNRDLSFDAFTVQQLAGDLLPGATFEQTLATGFHRNTLTNREGGVDPEEFRVKAVIDRVNTTGTVWLGLTVNCCECHSHKYDPLTQREFYGLFAFFNDADEVDVSAPLADEIRAHEAAVAAHRDRRLQLQDALAQAKASLPQRQAKWERHPNHQAPDAIRQILMIAPTERTASQRQELARYYESIDENLRAAKTNLAEHLKAEPKLQGSQVMILRQSSQPRPSYVHVRGDFLRKGARVEPHTPAVLPSLDARGPKPDRLDLARWIADPSHPLTTRVAVNRIWQRLFGRGLVATGDDFGTRGDPPSHPELLDWLAAEFVARGWNQKAMIRAIALSAAYRQSSRYRPETVGSDPHNALLARQNRIRLEAETIRDVYLAASGLWDRRIGGPSVRPPLPAGIAELGYAGSVKWPESTGADRYRRGLYVFLQRTVPYPMLTTFDAPDSNSTCTRRERSNTPLQALTLLNDPVFVECARALGRRIERECPQVSGDARIRYAFRLCLSRQPTATELGALQSLYNDSERMARDNPVAADTALANLDDKSDQAASAAAMLAVCRTIVNLDEFISRE
jgi:mono/diheme cytochrome c family protein